MSRGALPGQTCRHLLGLDVEPRPSGQPSVGDWELGVSFQPLKTLLWLWELGETGGAQGL